MELARGIEPPTCGLQNHCSAIELRQLVSQWDPNIGSRVGKEAACPLVEQAADCDGSLTTFPRAPSTHLWLPRRQRRPFLVQSESVCG